ncbi:MAG: type I DNA topoisomerase [Paracoccaceae bacterium]|jgi:DNA topoisomerase-1|nr:type I DNA topoisomerase [Paracoccaceae bacterium]MDG1677344.1 type I DNA topoisomerase [Paracoccaceae bacterium]MDG2247739.1 type I DNA topoisomerase [Paracoccaceae bacterium]
MPVVVVESPAKAKTINKYLGSDYTVLASYGHIRDLPAKDGSVDPDKEFDMKWEIGTDSKKHVKAIADALKEDNELILATDPDREGEAISWHLEETLRNKRVIKDDTPVSRVVFNAITKSAVSEAMANPREIDAPLVHAYLARRALDYLVGFNLSPVLWRKLPGAKSAGRVQSVCLRLIVEREIEVEAFKPKEYWSVKASLKTPRGQIFEGKLINFAGTKLDKYDLKSSSEAELAAQAISTRELVVSSVESKPTSRNPFAPFMTSTLQQEAGRKYGMGARQTMQAAQRLYEAGHITYMRTDGIDMAPEAVTSTREAIKERYGEKFLPSSPRFYKNKAKNAQEAHECIRPTSISKDSKQLKLSDPDQFKLYDLIWKRTISCQMESAKLERTSVDLQSPDKEVTLRANGQVVLFEGFLKVYEESRDDAEQSDSENRLPQMSQGENIEKLSIDPEQHFTQPPPRYTEASLVKRMEELGIGRPSTYANIVTTIQDREYVRKEKNRLFPEDKGRIVTIFLLNFFKRYVEFDFTAGLENQLDAVSAGKGNYKELLGQFWDHFSEAISETSELRITEVLDVLDDALAPQLYPKKEDGSDPRKCPKCGNGQLHLKSSRTGGFVGCGNYPECKFTRPISGEPDETAERLLGDNDGDQIFLKTGRYGPYVQRGESSEDNKKPPRASLPKGWSASDIELEKALKLLSLPREIGAHPEDGQIIEAGIGRYGPFVRHGRTYANLKDPEDVFNIGMNRAVEELAKKVLSGNSRGATSKALKELGEHPDGGGLVNVMDGRYGPYIKYAKINATIPKEKDPEKITMEEAVIMIAEKAAKGKKRGKKK